MKTTFTLKLLAIIAGLFITTRLLAQEQQAITIHVEEPGTLSSYIADSKKYQISNLKIIGDINGGDIRIIREMAGAGEKDEDKTDGILSYLDLSEANIVEGGDYYYRIMHQIGSSKYYTEDNYVDIYMFKNCDFETILLPNSTERFDYRAFDNCKNLNEIIIGDSNLYFSSNNGILFDKEKANLILCPQRKSGQYIVPNTVIAINEHAFQETNISSIIIQDNVTSIGDYAFYKCSSLKSISLPNSLISIGNSAFYDCVSLTSMVIPEGIESLESRILVNCESLVSVTLPSTLKSIGINWLTWCDKLKAIYCYAPVPPSAEDESFNSEICSNATLYIPHGTYNAYWLAKGWGDFKNIVEMEEGATTANESISVEQDAKITPSANGLEIETATPMEVYVCNIKGQTVLHKTINGNESIQLPQGLYIVKIGNQTTKVLIK